MGVAPASRRACLAELILSNAQILAIDPCQPPGSEIAVGCGRVLRLGHGLSADRSLSSGASVVDCRGGAVLPGFVDAHLHFFSFADSLLSLNLRPSAGVRSVAQIQAVLEGAAETTPPGTWLKGKGYNDFYLKEGRHPNRWDLDRVTPHHPVKLTHRSHHAHVLNSLGLEIVGIHRETEDPPGGLIDRDPGTGEPSGLLFEMGEFLAERVPRWQAEHFARGVSRASRELASAGVTAFLDASPTAGPSRQAPFEEYKAKGLIPQRVVTMVGREALQELPPKDACHGDPPSGVSVWGVKVILDRTTGRLQPTQQELNETVREAQARGWPVAVHAVEEETVEAAILAFEAAASARGWNPGHRIEHASVCLPPLARRIAALGVTVTTQPSFVYYHGERYLQSVDPEKLPHLYPLDTLLRSGVAVAGSSDCPVVPPSPLMGIYAAVTRRAKNGEVVGPGQEIPVEDAVAIYTIRAAQAVGMAHSAGSLTPGKNADLVVLNRNPFTTPSEELKDIQVLLTMIGGEVVWTCGSW